MNKLKKVLAFLFRIEDNRTPWQKESDAKLKELGGSHEVGERGSLYIKWKDPSKENKYWYWVMKNNPHLKGIEKL